MRTAAPPPLPRVVALYAIAGIGLAVWAFPVLWGLLTSFKTERDVLAYPPKFVFEPTLANYKEVIFGATSIMAAQYEAWAARCGVIPREKIVALMQSQGVTRAFWEKDET